MTAEASDPKTPFLEISGVTVRFGPEGAQKTALEEVDLTVREGEFLTIVGASGSGKTTLLRAIDGLIPPTEGEVRLRGKLVTEPGRERGFVFQQDCLLPWRNIRDNVAFGLEVQGVDRETARGKSVDMLGLMGLSGTESLYPAELSGGMRQRVNLARALATDPELLLMDEPFAALDAQTREVLQLELLEIWQRQRKTVIFVTHQLDEAIYLADRVVVLAANPGKVRAIVEVTTPRPRPLEVKHTSESAEQVDALWQLIKQEVMSDKRI